MISSATVIGFFCLYMGALFLAALWAQKRADAGRGVVDNPVVYSLSLAVYCSALTIYGGVGLAAERGPLFVTLYLGPTLAAFFGFGLWRKMARLTARHRITSIADFISTRYDRSATIAALVTVMIWFGAVPYVALQLKAVLTTFSIITGSDVLSGREVGAPATAFIVGLMILFTIVFGIRRLEPGERHEGMVMAVAVESLVKLISCLAVGIFVVFILFDGPADIFDRALKLPEIPPAVTRPTESISIATWFCYLGTASIAFLCLPRQFHVTVVENKREGHIRYAMWLFPLYLFAINLFIYPSALAGLLQGLPAGHGDTFLLQLPLMAGQKALSLLLFLGGFSAAASMIMISSMTVATMTSNHLLLPLLDRAPAFDHLKSRLLQWRWFFASVYIILGYGFMHLVGHHFRLVDLGMISFVAALQLGPVLLGGLYWRGGARRGAIWALTGGATVWLYTLIFPAILQSIGAGAGLIENGPWGISLLKPQALFGLESIEPVPHAVVWSLMVNVGLFLAGSITSDADRESENRAFAFVDVIREPAYSRRATGHRPVFPLGPKTDTIRALFSGYFDQARADRLTKQAIWETGLEGQSQVSIAALADLYECVEKNLGAAIGSAAAHRALTRIRFFTDDEAAELREMYAEVLAESGAAPQDLRRQADYYQERANMMNRHAGELEAQVAELERQASARMAAEAEIRDLSRMLIQGIEEERRRLASDLHDEFGQALTGLHMGVEAMTKSLPDDLESIKIKGVRLVRIIEQLAENLRGICGELRPDMLDHLGLVPTVEGYINDFRDRFPDIDVDFQAMGFRGRKLDPAAEIALYRIIQEALNNVVKHSGAGRVQIRLAYSHPEALLSIRDNGRGFDQGEPDQPPKGIGLSSMKERAAAVGGSFEVNALPGKGTAVRVTLPAARNHGAANSNKNVEEP